MVINEAIKIVPGKDYRLEIIQGVDGLNLENDNVDVEIVLDSGEKYVATFFTLENIACLFERNKITNECGSGTYFWATDMIIVECLTEEILCKTIDNLIANRELEIACSRIDNI